MKKVLLFGASFLLVAWSFTSCEQLSDCGYCKNVTYENGSVVNEGAETEYCGQDLIAEKNTPPVTVGSLTTKVVCR
jgi:hypothetical protein